MPDSRNYTYRGDAPDFEKIFKSQQQEEITLRDLFAAAALTGLVTKADKYTLYYESMTQEAYYIADVMIKNRKG